MRQISKKPVNLIPPDNVEMKWVDAQSGLLTSENCPGAQLLPFVEGSAPSEFAECGIELTEPEPTQPNNQNSF